MGCWEMRWSRPPQLVCAVIAWGRVSAAWPSMSLTLFSVIMEQRAEVVVWVAVYSGIQGQFDLCKLKDSICMVWKTPTKRHIHA